LETNRTLLFATVPKDAADLGGRDCGAGAVGHIAGEGTVQDLGLDGLGSGCKGEEGQDTERLHKWLKGSTGQVIDLPHALVISHLITFVRGW
jgi:hypothetical protein